MTDLDRPRPSPVALLAVAAVIAGLSGCGTDPEASDGATTAAGSPSPSAATSSEPPASSAIACTTAERTPPSSGSTWKHPTQSFYTGSEAELPSREDLEHLLSADAAAVARYDATRLPAVALDALRAWAESGEAVVALPADTATSAPVEVELLTQTLSCDGVDTGQLDAFVATRATTTDPH